MDDIRTIVISTTKLMYNIEIFVYMCHNTTIVRTLAATSKKHNIHSFGEEMAYSKHLMV